MYRPWNTPHVTDIRPGFSLSLESVANVWQESPSLEEGEFVFLMTKILYEAYVNTRNNVGRTSLHNATQPPHGELTAGHQEVVLCLVDEHGCETFIGPSNVCSPNAPAEH